MLARDEFDRYLFLAEELALWAIDRIGLDPPPPAEVHVKASPGNLVSDTDRAVEEYVRTRILSEFPEHTVLGEELAPRHPESSELVWYLDPIDGTTNFVHGVPFFAFSLALVDQSGPLVGVVAEPVRRDLFSAVRGRGARLNGSPMHCAPTVTLAGQLVLTELVGHRTWPGMEQTFARLSAMQATVRVMGSSALSLANVACGRAAASVLGESNAWDALAGVLIAREAGARVLGRDGREHDGLPTGGVVVAGAGVSHQVWRAWSG